MPSQEQHEIPLDLVVLTRVSVQSAKKKIKIVYCTDNFLLLHIQILFKHSCQSDRTKIKKCIVYSIKTRRTVETFNIAQRSQNQNFLLALYPKNKILFSLCYQYCQVCRRQYLAKHGRSQNLYALVQGQYETCLQWVCKCVAQGCHSENNNKDKIASDIKFVTFSLTWHLNLINYIVLNIKYMHTNLVN